MKYPMNKNSLLKTVYSELFETVIRETTPEKDYLFQPLEPINYAGEPFHAFENTLFEMVLKEAHDFEINPLIK